MTFIINVKYEWRSYNMILNMCILNTFIHELRFMSIQISINVYDSQRSSTIGITKGALWKSRLVSLGIRFCVSITVSLFSHVLTETLIIALIDPALLWIEMFYIL